MHMGEKRRCAPVGDCPSSTRDVRGSGTPAASLSSVFPKSECRFPDVLAGAKHPTSFTFLRERGRGLIIPRVPCISWFSSCAREKIRFYRFYDFRVIDFTIFGMLILRFYD